MLSGMFLNICQIFLGISSLYIKWHHLASSKEVLLQVLPAQCNAWDTWKKQMTPKVKAPIILKKDLANS